MKSLPFQQNAIITPESEYSTPKVKQGIPSRVVLGAREWLAVVLITYFNIILPNGGVHFSVKTTGAVRVDSLLPICGLLPIR